jgi:hypothetical protein
MIDWLWRRTLSVARPWHVFILFLIAFLFTFALFRPRIAHYPAMTIDGTNFGISPSQAKRILGTFAEAGQLDAYLEQEAQIDLVFPLVYALLLAGAIAGLGRPLNVPHWLVALPYAAAISDFVENFSVIGMIVRLRGGEVAPDALAWTASIGSRLKWGLLTGSLLVIGVLALWRIVRAARA